jgi:TRAP-type uncharacterized transport system fused permease subunit
MRRRRFWKKYDRESNIRYGGVPRRIIRYLLVAFAVYSVMINSCFNWETRIERASFVGCLVVLIFLVFPATRTLTRKQILSHGMIRSGADRRPCLFLFRRKLPRDHNRGIMLTPVEVALGIAGVLVTLEACRRAVGMPIVIVSSAFIIYALSQKSLEYECLQPVLHKQRALLDTDPRLFRLSIVLFGIFGAFLE